MKKKTERSAKAIKYQIRYCDNKGNGYFKYVDVQSSEQAPQVASDFATKHLSDERAKEGGVIGTFDIWSAFRPPFKPKRTINVWEWDNEKKEPKRGGHRFKLVYCYVEATYLGGGKRRKEWYEPSVEVENEQP